MTMLAELSKSASEMSDEELLARVRELRVARTVAAATPVKKPAKSKAAASTSIDPSTMDRTTAAALLELLEGLTDD